MIPFGYCGSQACFPRSIDRLRDECAHFAGPAPAMFATTDDTEFLSFLSGADGSGQPALGAEQLVIVRDQVSGRN